MFFSLVLLSLQKYAQYKCMFVTITFFCSLEIVKYRDNWVTTVELADSMKPRGQLSTRVCDVAIEYIRDQCRVEKRLVFPYLVVNHLLSNEFTKKCVLNAFKRQKNYSLTVQNQV